MEDRIYIAIDLKSFYASVECRERGLDPLIPTLSWQTSAARTKQSVSLSHHL